MISQREELEQELIRQSRLLQRLVHVMRTELDKPADVRDQQVVITLTAAMDAQSAAVLSLQNAWKAAGDYERQYPNDAEPAVQLAVGPGRDGDEYAAAITPQYEAAMAAKSAAEERGRQKAAADAVTRESSIPVVEQ